MNKIDPVVKHEVIQEWAKTLAPDQCRTLRGWQRNMYQIRGLGDMGQSELIYEILIKKLSIRRKNAQ